MPRTSSHAEIIVTLSPITQNLSPIEDYHSHAQMSTWVSESYQRLATVENQPERVLKNNMLLIEALFNLKIQPTALHLSFLLPPIKPLDFSTFTFIVKVKSVFLLSDPNFINLDYNPAFFSTFIFLTHKSLTYEFIMTIFLLLKKDSTTYNINIISDYNPCSTLLLMDPQYLFV
ncbi:hypothetical protein BDB01DRAFT_839526 [Pilobolus umbonatus]|nr:hypothetical protein BDB01DRAFT_839526 [Pilobolus umbonatus]